MSDEPLNAKVTRLEKMERWLRDQPILSVLILVGLILTGLAEFVQRGSDLLVTVGLKEEKTLKLAADNAKGEFSRKLTESAYRRIFWTNNYLARVELRRPKSELDYSWDKHLDTVADWSAEYLVNLQGMTEYYPRSDKAIQFEAIHENLRDLENCRIVPLRTLDSDGQDHRPEVEEAKNLLDQINVSLYFLALNNVPGANESNAQPPSIPKSDLCPDQKSDHSHQPK